VNSLGKGEAPYDRGDLPWIVSQTCVTCGAGTGNQDNVCDRCKGMSSPEFLTWLYKYNAFEDKQESMRPNVPRYDGHNPN